MAEPVMPRYKRAEIGQEELVDTRLGAAVSRNAQSLRTGRETPRNDRIGLRMKTIDRTP
jgi:hypothetical protein